MYQETSLQISCAVVFAVMYVGRCELSSIIAIAAAMKPYAFAGRQPVFNSPKSRPSLAQNCNSVAVEPVFRGRQWNFICVCCFAVFAVAVVPSGPPSYFRLRQGRFRLRLPSFNG
jgi:hypothetical protein